MKESRKKLEELKDLAVAQSCLAAQLFSACDQIDRDIREREPSVYLEARVRAEFQYRQEVYKARGMGEMPSTESDIWKSIMRAIREEEEKKNG